jgi:hypothetical protein
MNSEHARLFITPETAHPHAILWQSYSIEHVAQIAASIIGGTYHDRVTEALKLLEAAEKIAKPDPWEDQHLLRCEGDGLGDMPEETDPGGRRFEIARNLVAMVTAKDGRVPLKDLLAKCYEWDNREVTDSARRKAFAAWAMEAAQFEHWQIHTRNNPLELCAEGFERWKRHLKPPKPDTTSLLSRFGLTTKKGKTGVFLR